MRTAGPWIENRATGVIRWPDLRELWSYRELVGFLALRDVKARHKQTVLGVAWTVLNPLIGAAVVTVVFSRLIDVPSDGIPYAVFAFIGYVLWAYISSSLSTATDSLVANNDLVTKVYFPRLAAPLAGVLPALVNLATSLVVLAVLLVVYSVNPGIEVVTIPLWIAGAMALTLGVGLALAVLNTHYRDIGHLTGFGMQLWLFLSPVVYPSSVVPEGWRTIYALNPVVGLMDGFRWAAANGPAPGATLAVSIGVLAVLLIGGAAVFGGLERRIADVI